MRLASTQRLGHLLLAGLLLAIGPVACFAFGEAGRLPLQPPTAQPIQSPLKPRLYTADVVPAFAPPTGQAVRTAEAAFEAEPAAGTTDPPLADKQPDAPLAGHAVAASDSSQAAGPEPGASATIQPTSPDNKATAEAANPDQPIDPIPSPQAGGPVEIEPASFNGVTPGATTRDQLKATWGEPKQVGKHGDVEAHLYSLEPFEQVEVTFAGNKIASVVIRLERPFPAKTVAQQLELAAIQPVLVSSDLGEILGQAFPERGVLFSFEPGEQPGQTTMQVTQIILEPISAESFTLRAETNLDTAPTAALADLDQSLKLVPNNGRAHWLRAKILSSKGLTAKALEAAQQAVAIDGINSHYQLTYAQILNQSGKYEEAVAAAKSVLKSEDRRAHVKAQALCLLGDLAATGPEHDYRAAIAYHAEAIKTADPLATAPHPAIRLAAKEVLIDAHLGAASDIAWGQWKQKEVSVTKWLSRASAFADEMIANDGGNDKQRFRVAVRALSTYVGLQGKLDPTDWAKQAVEVGDRLIAAAKEPAEKQQIAWDLGMALYDGVQIYQARSENEHALECGELAITRLQQGGKDKQDSLAYSYLLGRVHFRLGAIHAVGKQDHEAALAWFNKAVPLLSRPVPEEALCDLARHGETFVSMAVTYWENDQKEKAMALTGQGIALMEQAVKDGTANRSILNVPYGNMATMHKAMGEEGLAERWVQMATGNKDTTQQ